MKRLFDIVFGLVIVPVVLPVIAIVAVLIWAKMGGPVFFRQVRSGLHGRAFRMIKFRTMTDARDATGELLPDEERITRFGAFLRKTSLDELPEIVNVFLGHMSFVGPRPLPVRYEARYSAEHARRHDVRPGITGWAQVNGRNLLSWMDKFDLDVWYVDNHTFMLDMKILFMTIRKVVASEGISSDTSATMEEFFGYSDKPFHTKRSNS